jgi:hypothetical protein
LFAACLILLVLAVGTIWLAVRALARPPAMLATANATPASQG